MTKDAVLSCLVFSRPRSARLVRAASAQLLHGRSAADASPALAATLRSTSRPYGHRWRCTKRLAIRRETREESTSVGQMSQHRHVTHIPTPSATTCYLAASAAARHHSGNRKQVN